MDEIARRIGLTTILNTVPNRQGRVAWAFFGDVTAAFRAGVAKAVEVYAVPLPGEADIVLSSSHPCDLDFWQAHKTQYPSDLAVKPGDACAASSFFSRSVSLVLTTRSVGCE